MASIEENRHHWSSVYSWEDGGEEWSEVWGGSEPQWRGSIRPRIDRFLPAGTVLEIGCGRGRWSRRLRTEAERLILVDLVEACVASCAELFDGDVAVRCLTTDGRSLAGVESGSVDFAFSFDSLVHAEMDVLEAYVRELGRVLSAEGVAFLHHSNMEAVLRDRPGAENRHWRGESVSAEKVAAAAEAAGLGWLRQEIVDWGGVESGDVLTTLVRPGGRHDGEPIRLVNAHFMGEAQSLAVRWRLYGEGSGRRG